MIKKLEIRTPGQGLHEFTSEVDAAVSESEVDQGLCTVFVQHTSASLVIQENRLGKVKLCRKSALRDRCEGLPI